MEQKYPRLIESAKMGPFELPNRIVMAPMGSLNADKFGYVTERTLKFYDQQAAGRMGMLIVECTYIDDKASKGEDNCMGLTENGQVTGMARLASVIHDHDVKAILQLCHIGHQLSLAGIQESWGPSTMIEMNGDAPFSIRGISKAEIKQCERDFASAAYRAKMAGFDGVEVHGAIGHLINMFCSPFYNHRSDEYGGSPENRVRFFREIIKEIQNRCGDDFPIIARVCGDEFSPDGINIEEGTAQALILQETGVFAMHVVAGDNRNVRTINAQYDRRGDFIEVARAFKKAGIRLPIILDGGFTTPDIAEKALEEGGCDFIGLGRPMLADPAWAIKLKENRPEDIKPCIRCTMGCVGTVKSFAAALGLRCSVNPQCNMAGLRDLRPIDRVKRVCVIGGGPGGMEAARVLRIRGHEVDLYEKRKLGGTMHEAAFDTSFKHDIVRLIDYYRIQMKKLGVNVIEREATADTVLAGHYDAVIIAAGARALPPSVRGGKEHADRIMSIYDYAKTGGKAELGGTVLVVGGCFMNLEVAYSLLRKGKNVIVSSRRGRKYGMVELGDDNSSPQQQRLKILLEEFGERIRFCFGRSLAEVTDDGAKLIRVLDKKPELVKCDNVLICRGYVGRPKIYEELRERVPEIHVIGDAAMKLRCDDKRVIGDAITDAFGIANNI